jgi:hypothetical protein
MRYHMLCLLICCFWSVFPTGAWAGGAINSGETKSGNISGPSYLDSWTFEGQEGERVVIGFAEAAGTRLYTKYIYLYPPGGGPQEAFNAGPNVSLSAKLKHTGTYTIVLQDDGLDNAFSYNVSLVKGTGSEGAIVSGQTLSGSIVPSGLKAYRFSGQAGERAVIGFAEASGSRTYTKYIYLYPPSGGPQEAFNAGPNVTLSAQLKESGTYMVVLNDDGLNDSYDYNVSLVKTTGTDGYIAPGQLFSGALIPSSLKAYRFDGQVGEHIVVGFAEASGSRTYTKYIYLYPPSGGPQEAFNAGPNVTLSAQLKESGTYMIVLNDDGLNDSYAYNVSLVKNSGPFASQNYPDGGALISGQTRSGSLIPGLLRGYYFYGQAGERALIGFAEASGSRTYTKYIYLYPPSGGPQEAFNAGPNVVLDHQLIESGLYMIVLEDDGLDNSYNYNVSLTKIPAGLPPGLYNPSPGDANTHARAWGNLTWTPVAGATGYDLYFGSNIFQPLPKIGNNFSTASLPLPDLNLGQVYYWRVVAHTNSGDLTGPIWWFVPKSGNIVPILGLLLQ